MEFIGFDIKESLSEYLEKDEVRLNQLRESQSEIIKNIAVIEASLSKVNNTLQDSFMANNPEILNLKSVLEEEVTKLKASHRVLSGKIKTFESNAVSDAGVDVGDEVRINETGDCATVTSINSSRNTVTVVTEEGKSVEMSIDKVSSTADDSEKANAKNSANDNVVESTDTITEATENLKPKSEEEKDKEEDTEEDDDAKKSSDEDNEEEEEEDKKKA
jgi:hypothetical protein